MRTERTRIAEGIYVRKGAGTRHMSFDIQFRRHGRQFWRSFPTESAATEFREAVKAGRADETTPTSGVWVRHMSFCDSDRAGSCNCIPRFEVFQRHAQSKRREKRSFSTLEEVLAWHEQARGYGVNPLSEFVVLANYRIREMERERGEALPHLYLARSYLAELYAAAERDAKYLWADAGEEAA